MDGNILANSIIALKGTDLRMVYALLCKTNIGDLLSTKTKDLFSREGKDHFTLHLEKEVAGLKGESDAAIQVNLFLELTKLLKRRGTKYLLEQEIEDQCTGIVDDVYLQYQKQDKKFRAFAELQGDSTKLQQMINFQMRKIFDTLDHNFKEFSIDDQIEFASQVNEYIRSLSEEKQRKIKEKLGINDLTDEMVQKTLATSGTSIVFAIIVEVSGFAFYTTATTLLASFAGLFGITLPFGVYTTLTSTIAILASPIFIIPLVLGGGVFIVNHQNQSLKKKLLPIIIMQITLPYMSNGQNRPSFDAFIEEWENRFENYQDLAAELIDANQEERSLRDQIQNKEKEISSCEKEKTMEQIRLEAEKKAVSSFIENATEKLDISASYKLHRSEFNEVSEKIRKLEYSKRSGVFATGFLDQLGSKVKNIGIALDIKDEEKKRNVLLEKMVEDLLSSSSDIKRTERDKINQRKEYILQLTKQIDQKKIQIKELERLKRTVFQNSVSIRNELRRSEKENFGMEDLRPV